jgi:hypothetical protein
MLMIRQETRRRLFKPVCTTHASSLFPNFSWQFSDRIIDDLKARSTFLTSAITRSAPFCERPCGCMLSSFDAKADVYFNDCGCHMLSSCNCRTRYQRAVWRARTEETWHIVMQAMTSWHDKVASHVGCCHTNYYLHLTQQHAAECVTDCRTV